jgi:predicted RNase H-like HicB family nuclease
VAATTRTSSSTYFDRDLLFFDEWAQVRLIHDGRILFKDVTETGHLREHLTQNLSIDWDDFDTIPLLQRPGGWGAANRAFEGRLAPLPVEINAAVAARVREEPMSDTRPFTARIYREGGGYVALCPELDVASQGDSVEDASSNLSDAVELFLETAAPREIARREGLG